VVSEEKKGGSREEKNKCKVKRGGRIVPSEKAASVQKFGAKRRGKRVTECRRRGKKKRSERAQRQ